MMMVAIVIEIMKVMIVMIEIMVMMNILIHLIWLIVPSTLVHSFPFGSFAET